MGLVIEGTIGTILEIAILALLIFLISGLLTDAFGAGTSVFFPEPVE